MTLLPPPHPGPLLSVRNLSVALAAGHTRVQVLDRISFDLARGRTLGIVGESGAGKSILARSLVRLLPKTARIPGRSEIIFDRQELTRMGPGEMNRIRGRRIAMIFQDPLSCLNPVMTVGSQIAESLTCHMDMGRQAALNRSVQLLKSVGIPDPETRVRQYPHTLSGGMRQRVAIAIALACEPDLLIADEPTTALDTTVQAQILSLLARRQQDNHMAMILITHDLGVAAAMAHEILVLYAGKIVEQAPAKELFSRMHMPYTRALMAAMPRIGHPAHTQLEAIEGPAPDPAHLPEGCRFAPRCPKAEPDCIRREPPLMAVGSRDHLVACWHPEAGPCQQHPSIKPYTRPDIKPNIIPGQIPPEKPERIPPPLLRAENLTIEFKTQDRQRLRAVDRVSFEIARGQTLGLVGESGCGKSSLARAVMMLPGPKSGHILFEGRDLTRLDKTGLRGLRPRFQMVFQDSVSSLNPRRSILDTLTAAVPDNRGAREKNTLAEQMLARVGIDPKTGSQKPDRFSGGQCQRIQIARALMTGPDLLVCDEPVSSLDVSIQAQILNLLETLRKDRSLTILFISHDLAVVKHACDRVMVMYLGRICESAPSQTLYTAPFHPYTRALLSAVPTPGSRPSQVHLRQGELPSPAAPPSGCRFRTRCPRARERCAGQVPRLREITPTHWAACHFPLSRPNHHPLGATHGSTSPSFL